MNTNEKDFKIFRLEKEVGRLKKAIKKQRYGLVWLDVPEAFEDDVENKLPILEEEPKFSIKSKDKKPAHILIEGDNYHVLNCLNYTHKGKIDVVYIDPPYNTGSDGFKYKDKRILDKFPDGTEVPLDHPLRHSYWLSFMSKRLELARDILKKEGLFFVSIDDNEYAQLKLLCDDVLGENNYITTISVKMSHLSGVKMSHLDKKLPKLKEYLLMYAKNKQFLNIQPVYESVLPEKAFERYNSYLLKDKKYQDNIDLWKVITLKEAMRKAGINIHNIEERNNFYITHARNIFRTARNRSDQFTKLPNDDKFRHVITATGLKKIAYKREEVILVASKLQGEGRDASLVQPLGDLWTDIGINNLHNEGGVEFRNGKKPLKLIERIIKMCPNKDAIVLDFFAGSGTTCEAVMNLNQKDNGKRQCILVTNNDESTNGKVYNIMTDKCYPRVKNVIEGYNGKQGLGNSLRYFKACFVGRNNILRANDNDKIELALNVGGMLALAENTLDQIEENKFFQFFENEKQYTAIYFREELNEFEKFIKKIKAFKKPVTVYVFSWEKELELDELEVYKNIKVKTIPQPILEIYKQIYNLN
jgi:adenine-specific DNA-methyltransferase